MKSKLVTYINLTKNKTTVNNKQNNYIIPHVYVGNITTRSGVDHFTTDCGASCHYVIGVDGSIGQSVSEADRAWTTGGNKEISNKYGLFVGGTPNKSQVQRGAKGVDYEAITIEMACEPKHPYEINDKVYNSLINLMADIAIRNNMGELKWKADPSLVGNPSEQNILVHRWFASKSCPGDYVYKHLQDICEKANEIIKASKTNQTNNSSTNQTKPVEISTEQLCKDAQDKYIWDKLNKAIGNEIGVAGLMGNLQAESGLRPNNLQNSFEKKLGMTDEQYTQAVNNGTYSREQFSKDSAGYGLTQWTHWTRKQNLYDYAKQHKAGIADLDMQIDFLIQELKTSYKGVFNALKTAKSIKQASDVVLTQFERPKDQSDKVKEQRASYGNDIYKRFVGQAVKPAEQKPVEQKPAEQKQSEIVYTVRAGDTLSAIANKYKTTYQKIAKDNGIKNVNIIYVGQKLVIK